MSNPKRIAVIGGGAAGLTAAGRAASLGASVTLYEKNEKVGRKLAITGKGRCNLTNLCPENEFIANLTKNPRFLYSSIASFSCSDTFDFFTSLGVPLKTERGNRVFPESDKAYDVVDALLRYCRANKVKIVFNKVTGIKKEGDVFEVFSEKDGKDGHSVFDACIICTGGVSYPATGSDGDGYRFARSLGHTLSTPVPSLVPLVTESGLASEMQGLSLKNVGITVSDNMTGKKVYTDFGEALFTHFGLSGPVILSASAHMREPGEGRYTVFFDLKPALDLQTLDKRLLREFSEAPNKELSVCIRKLLPSTAVGPFLKFCGIDGSVRVNSVTAAQRKTIAEALKKFSFVIKGFRPIAEAVITSGGIPTDEISPATMESKKTKGLYFAGEIIDCDAYTGGFNLQIAFCTAMKAAVSAAAQ